MIVEPMKNPETTVRLKRTFAASREKVFRAWTDPEEIKKWLAPAGCSTPSAEIELRVGGKYRLGMQFPQEDPFYVSGTYREVEPPVKLVFTWRWEKSAVDIGESLVTIEFYDRGGATEVVLTHEQLPNKTASRQHQQGWRAIFDKLANVIIARKEE